MEDVVTLDIGTSRGEIMQSISEDFYSNCLIEALKAKLQNRKVKMYVFHKSDNVVYCPHIMWSDGEYDYDFGIEQHIPLLSAWTIHKGHIRQYRLGTIQRYLKYKSWVGETDEEMDSTTE